MFWEYFRDTLNWPLLKSRYLQVIVRGLALYMDDITADMRRIRNEYLPEESTLLDDFAASRGVKRTPADTDEQYRARVLAAYRWQMMGGKERGLVEILKEYGYPGAQIEYFDDPERWAEFGVRFDEQYGQNLFGLIPLINEYKPARSKLGNMQTPARTEGIYSVVGYTQLPDTMASYKERKGRYSIVGYTRIEDYINSLAVADA
jgi:hypothetical protein